MLLSTLILLVLPPEAVVEGLGVVVFPVGDTVLLPGEVEGGRELEVEGGEEGGGPVVSVILVVVVEDEDVVVGIS